MTEPQRPLFWHQGLFLQPQHFQQLEQYGRSLLGPLLQYRCPCFWGVRGLRIQGESLKKRVFEIAKGEALFQDGTWAAFPGNARVQPRSFEDVSSAIESGSLFRVFLALKKWDPREPNVAVSKDDRDPCLETRRYACPTDPEEVKDLYGDGPPASVRFMTVTLKIVWETEVNGYRDHWLIPVAGLEQDGADVRLAEDFIPSTMTLDGSDALMSVLKNVRDQVTSRCHALESYTLTPDVRASEFEGNYLRYLLALNLFNRYVPLLHHWVETPTVHPWHLFGLFRQLVGELSTFTDRVNALGRLVDETPLLPDYDHEDLSGCFHGAETLIEELVNAIIVGAENVIHLVRDGNDFKGRIPPEAFSDRNAFCLVVRTDEEADTVHNAVEHLAKVGSEESMPNLMARALPGIPAEARVSPPPGVPKRPGSYYFSLDRAHPRWADLARSGNVCLHWDEAPEDAAVDLVISRM
jgi:type VI secretion system protein ImpJ